ncbi:HupE/UreJ family protein [Methyloversatilis sp.]|uniref:HupE/UreJ family protein n=1 Tax=Methyloversatilis sp. TaxID=2569862 RepID=UPI0035B162F0
MKTVSMRHFLRAGALLALLAPTLALAHQESGQATGLLAGLTHPVSGMDHVLAMVAVGLWGAVLGQPAIWVLPVAFPLMMALGGLMGLLGFPLPGVEIGIAASAIVLGTVVLTELRLPLLLATLITALFAIFHGHAHGAELPEGASALMYSLGFVMATGLLHAVGILLGAVHGRRLGRKVVRAAGGGVALAGLFFMWKALA